MLRKIVSLLSACALLVVLAPSGTGSPGPIEQRGCCSHHGGVSGSCCANNHALCNDGACSPSCKC